MRSPRVQGSSTTNSLFTVELGSRNSGSSQVTLSGGIDVAGGGAGTGRSTSLQIPQPRPLAIQVADRIDIQSEKRDYLTQKVIAGPDLAGVQADSKLRGSPVLVVVN